MKNIKSMLVATSLLTVLALPAYSGENEQKYALRFGGVVLDPTASSTIRGENTELDTAVGGELNFEWYFKPSWGLDLSSVGAIDVEDKGGDRIDGISIRPFTIGINYHPVRTHTVDWSVGALVGGVSYGDFVVDGDTLSVTTENDLAYGVQTSVDLSPQSWEHWAFNLGVKYLNTSAAFAGTPGEVSVDPLIWRAMLVYRW